MGLLLRRGDRRGVSKRFLSTAQPSPSSPAWLGSGPLTGGALRIPRSWQIATPITCLVLGGMAWLVYDSRNLGQKLRLPSSYKDGVQWVTPTAERSRSDDAIVSQAVSRLQPVCERSDTAANLLLRTSIAERFRAFKLNRLRLRRPGAPFARPPDETGEQPRHLRRTHHALRPAERTAPARHACSRSHLRTRTHARSRSSSPSLAPATAHGSPFGVFEGSPAHGEGPLTPPQPDDSAAGAAGALPRLTSPERRRSSEPVNTRAAAVSLPSARHIHGWVVPLRQSVVSIGRYYRAYCAPHGT